MNTVRLDAVVRMISKVTRYVVGYKACNGASSGYGYVCQSS